jgi:hypothetical protein
MAGFPGAEFGGGPHQRSRFFHNRLAAKQRPRKAPGNVSRIPSLLRFRRRYRCEKHHMAIASGRITL